MGKRGRKPIYTGFERVCLACGRTFQVKERDQRYCSFGCAHELRAERICLHCGKTFHPKSTSRTSYCSRECAFEHKQHRCKTCGKPMRGDERDYCSDECKSKIPPKRYEHICIICGIKFMGTKQAKICSDECRRKQGRDNYRASFVSARETNPLIIKKCKYCGIEFTTNFMIDRRIYCSRRCADRASRTPESKRIENRRREAKKRGCIRMRYKDIDIYESEHWMCHICGKKIDRRLRHPHLMSATIDHMVPLALGGADAPINLRAAHMICNARKCAKAMGQLKLFG